MCKTSFFGISAASKGSPTWQVTHAHLFNQNDLQLLNLLLVLPQQGILGVLIDAGVFPDVPGPTCVAQGAEAFLVAVISLGHAHHHQGPGVPPQGVLEQPGQLGVSVGNVSAPAIQLGLRWCCPGQTGKGFGGLFEPLPCGTSPCLSLTSCQIQQVEFGSPEGILPSQDSLGNMSCSSPVLCLLWALTPWSKQISTLSKHCTF